MAALAEIAPPAEYERARASLRAALRADDEPAVRAWLVAHEPATMGRRNRPPRSQRQAARRAQQDTRRAASSARRTARQASQLDREQARQEGRSARTALRQERRTEAAEGRAERRDIRQAEREERRALRGDGGGGGIDAGALEETAGNVVSQIREWAGGIFGGGGAGGGGGGGGGQAQDEEKKSGSALPIVLGLAAVGGLAYFATKT